MNEQESITILRTIDIEIDLTAEICTCAWSSLAQNLPVAPLKRMCTKEGVGRGTGKDVDEGKKRRLCIIMASVRVTSITTCLCFLAC